MEKNNTHPAAEFTLPPPAALPTTVIDRSVTTDLASDFVLPDYLPEVKRLLRVTATPLPDTRYISAASAEFSGAVEYLVCYAGGDGGLWSTRLRQDYNANTPIDADLVARGITPVADAQLDSVVSRVTGPRKLNIRARLRNRIRAWGEEAIEPAIEGNPPPASLERLTKPCRAMRILRASAEPFDLSAEVSFDTAGGEPRVIRADGTLHIAEAIPEEGAVTCRGELILALLTCIEQEGVTATDPELTTRKVTFAETIPLDGATAGMSARAWGRCGDLAVQIEDGRILCDAAVWLELEAADEEVLALTADLYSTDGEIADSAYRDVEVSRLARCFNMNFTQSGAPALKDAGIDPRAEIIDTTAQAQLERIETVNGRCALDGTCRVSVIYRLDGEYGVGELLLPMRATVDLGQAIPDEYEGEATVIGLRCRDEGDGDARKLALDVEIALALRLFSREKRRILAAAHYHPSDAKPQAACTVCYPEPGDSIWSLCKRYRVSRAGLAAANQLRTGDDCDLPSSLEGVQYLLI